MTMLAMAKAQLARLKYAADLIDRRASIDLFGAPPDHANGNAIVGLRIDSLLRSAAKGSLSHNSQSNPRSSVRLADVAAILVPDRSFAFVEPAASAAAPTWPARLTQAMAAAVHVAGPDGVSKDCAVMVGSDCFEIEISEQHVWASVDLQDIVRRACANLVIPASEVIYPAARHEAELVVLPVLNIHETGSVLAIETNEPDVDKLSLASRSEETRSEDYAEWKRTWLLNNSNERGVYSLAELETGRSTPGQLPFTETCCVADLIFRSVPTMKHVTIDVRGTFAPSWVRFVFRHERRSHQTRVLFGGHYAIRKH